MGVKAIVGVAAAVLAVSPVAAAASEPRVGKPAPDFHATLYDGRKVSLADFKGQVLVLNFWATWCGPCRTELPLLNAYLTVAQKHGLSVLAVASPDSAEPSKLKPLAAKLTMPLVSRMSGPYDDLGGYPTNYVIDRAGVIRYAHAGAFNLDALNAVLIPLLNEHPPAEIDEAMATDAKGPQSPGEPGGR